MGSTDPTNAAHRALIMADREAVLRGAARILELDVSGDPEIALEAQRLYLMAAGRRRMRLAILQRAGLLE